MAKSSTNEIAKILNRIQGHDNYTVISDFFEISAIAVRNNVDYGKERDSYEQRYLSIVKKYRKEDFARKRNRQNYDRRYDATPKRKQQHKAWEQSPAGRNAASVTAPRKKERNRAEGKAEIIFCAIRTIPNGEGTA